MQFFSLGLKKVLQEPEINANNKQRFEITNIRLYVPVVILSTQDNEKNLLQQLKTGFRRTIHWNNYQSEPTI